MTAKLMTTPALVQKLWNYCNILRDDGLSCGNYVEQTRIVAEKHRRLSVVEERELVVNANLQRATGLQQSILSGSFGKSVRDQSL